MSCPRMQHFFLPGLKAGLLHLDTSDQTMRPLSVFTYYLKYSMVSKNELQGKHTYQIFINKSKQLSIHNKACEVLDVTQQIIKLQIKS